MTFLKSCDLARAEKSILLDTDSKATTLQGILSQQAKNLKRTLIVFIRHFFCGNCQEYVRRLSTELSPSSLPADLSLIIVGCGAPSLISSYVEITKCPFTIYADPSTQLYQCLGMQRSLSLGPKGPAYIHHSLASGMVKSIIQGIKRIPSGDVSKAGDLRVNGGEFLFVREAQTSEWGISWAHCMMNSRDHMEVDILKTKLQFTDQTHEIKTNSFLVQTPPNKDVETTSCSDLSDDDPCHKAVMPVRRSFTMKRHSWVVKATQLTRSSSLRNTMIHVS